MEDASEERHAPWSTKHASESHVLYKSNAVSMTMLDLAKQLTYMYVYV